MRAAGTEMKILKRDRVLRSNAGQSAARVPGDARTGAGAAIFSASRMNSLLLCLTRVGIFDNRHGLLKTFESARAAQTYTNHSPGRKSTC